MVGIISERTKRIDRTLRSLATDFRRTNIKSVRVGEAQPGVSETSKPQEPARGSGVIWANAKDVQEGKPIGDGKLRVKQAQSVKGEAVGIHPKGIGPGPRVGSFIADHENLKIDK